MCNTFALICHNLISGATTVSPIDYLSSCKNSMPWAIFRPGLTQLCYLLSRGAVLCQQGDTLCM